MRLNSIRIGNSVIQSLRLAIVLTMVTIGCATTSSTPPSGAVGAPVNWPFHGYTRYDGAQLNLFQDHFFAPGGLVIHPSGNRLIAPCGRPGALTIVRLPQGTIEAVYDFGEGITFENAAFRPDGAILYALCSTVEAANLGRVPLARALIEVEFGPDLGAPAIPLRPGGFSRGIALRPDRGWYYSLDSAGRDLPGGATLSRIDLYSQDVQQKRRLGSVPFRVRSHGLLYDERERWLLALLSNDEPASDFDPPADPAVQQGSFLARLDPDTLGIQAIIEFKEPLEFMGLVPSPRGVVAVGLASSDPTRGASLVEIDPRLGREIGWLDIPEPVSDMASAGDRLVMPTRRGLYVVSLEFLSIVGFIGIPFDRPRNVAVTPDGAFACVTFDDPEQPGWTALAIVDLDAGRLVRVIR